jgi:FkbM family methyltransferase
MPEKNLFGKKIKLCDVSAASTYSKDISPIFSWMQDIKLPKKPIVLDIGANLGLFSLSYAAMFEKAEIHCFEPIQFIYDYLKRNLESNPQLSRNVHAHNLGISNCTERKQLSIPIPQQHDRYRNETDIRHYSVLGHGEKKFDAKFVALDRWVEDFQLTSIDFIKIDVEGYEYPVLEGASKSLLAFRPIVKFELNELTLALSNRPADDYLRFAKDHGYEIYGQQYGYKRELLPINSEEQIKLISDLILFPSR